MFHSTKQTEFYLSGMYGYNGVLLSSHYYDETFYGPSFGVGLKINSRQKEGSFWDISLIYPVHSHYFISNTDSYLPVLISAGYNFMLTSPTE